MISEETVASANYLYVNVRVDSFRISVLSKEIK